MPCASADTASRSRGALALRACPAFVPVILIGLASLLLMAPSVARATSTPPAASAAERAVIGRLTDLLAAGEEARAAQLADSLLAGRPRLGRAVVMPPMELADSLSASFARHGRHARALAYGDRMLEEARSRLGPRSGAWAQALWRHATLRMAVGDATGAVEELSRTVAILDQCPDTQGEVLGDALEALATAYRASNTLDTARVILDRCLELRRRIFGPASLSVAFTLGLRGNWSRIDGDYARSLSDLESAVACADSLAAQDDSRLLTLYNRFGAILGTLRDDRRSIVLFRKCVDLSARRFGWNHLETARYLNNVGLNEWSLGNLEAARTAHDSALAIRRRIGDQGGVAESEANLGLLAMSQHRDFEADQYFRSSLTYNLSVRSISSAETMGWLVELNLRRGNLAAADSFSSLALDWCRGSLPPGHPSTIRALYNRARFLRARGQRTAAFDAALEVDRLERAHLTLTARMLVERQVFDYADSRPRGLDLALALASSGAEAHSCVPLWDAAIRGRGLVFEELAARQRMVLAESDTLVRGMARELASARRAHSALLTRGLGSADSSERLLSESSARIERLERQIAYVNASLRADWTRNHTGFAEVRDSLPEGAALVAYLRYQDPDPRPDERPAGERYAVFVLFDRNATPDLIDLGPASLVDSLVSAWRVLVTRRATDMSQAAEIERGIRRVGSELRRRVWDPVAPRMTRIRLVLVVPDGSLNLVNLAALPLDRSRFLVEAGPLIHQLTSERDLVRLPETGPRSEGLLVVGAPDFDHRPVSDSLLAYQEPDRTGMSAPVSRLRGARMPCRDFLAMRFGPLPAAVREAKDVAGRWVRARGPEGVRVLSGAEAGEARFKDLAPGRSVLHLATHGFFLDPGSCASGSDASDGPWLSRENPLRLCGLVLAGANLRADTGPEDEDGVLTAEEISTLDLRGVEWVVLSGCNTGVGMIRPGEGVLGLPRAFAIAGAATTIMSLWSVEDVAARQWMEVLYEAKLRGRSAAEAIRDADLSILSRLRARGQSAVTRWAAFIGTGDWR